MLQRIVPSFGEALPVIGPGTWQTFDVPGATPAKNSQLVSVLELFAEKGSMIDRSPVYRLLAGNGPGPDAARRKMVEWIERF